MMWEYTGRVVGPEVLPPGFSHLTGPYGVDIGGTLRIFFTSRRKTEGKSLESVPFFIDVDPDTLECLSSAVEVRYPKAELGSYRVHGVFPLSVFDLGSGALMGLPTGWRRHKGVDVETGIGEWLSLDGGVSWSEFGIGPKFSAGQNEPFLVCDASYQFFNNRHFLAYAYGVSWDLDVHSEPQRRYLITVINERSYGKLRLGAAHSSIPLSLVNEVQAFPHISISGGEMRMFFCYRSEFDFRSDTNSSYKLALATSVDGEKWVRESPSLEIKFGDGATKMQCYPTYLKINDRGILLFNGDGFGRTGIYAAYERS